MVRKVSIDGSLFAVKDSLDPPPHIRKFRNSTKGKTSKNAKEKIRKAKEIPPFAHECIDFLLRYEGRDSFLRRLKRIAVSDPDWLPTHDQIVMVNNRAVRLQQGLADRLRKRDGMDLPDSLADPGKL